MVESQKSDHAIDRIALAPEEDRGLLKNFPNRCIIHLYVVLIQDSRRLFPKAFANVLDVFIEVVLFFATALNTRLLIAICKTFRSRRYRGPARSLARKGSSATLWPTCQSYFRLSTLAR